MQSRFRRRCGAQEFGFHRRIGHPDWFCASPDLTEPALANLEDPLAADRVEFCGRDIRRMPKAIAAERDTLSLDTPQSAPFPLQVLADRPKQMWSGGGEAVGLRQNACDRVRRRHTLLAAPAFGDVFARNQNDRIIARPLHGLGILTHPKHRAVLTDFADLPAMRTAEFFYAGCHM